MSIGEFINIQKQKGLPSSRWSSEFRQAGYISVSLSQGGLFKWQAVHQWCKAEFGEEHYSWTGSLFWFEKEEHAVMFVLKWA